MEQITKEKYLRICSTALQNSSDTIFSNNDEKLKIAKSDAEKFYKDDEEKYIYVNNYMINDIKEFIEVFNSSGKNATSTAKHFEITPQIVMCKVVEINKYEDYINEILNKPTEVKEKEETNNLSLEEEIELLKKENMKIKSINSELLQENESLKTNNASKQREIFILQNKLEEYEEIKKR